ncbi:hypothetical protein CYG49_01910 [Candidatus Saccharibacteria bacterium]|nr:MAG: hypothetical protein CYG49_01910 [Candidatus Saccharibacteria bacterium]
MKTIQPTSFIQKYVTYMTYGVSALLITWILALLTTTFLPGPYHLDFFGVVAERTADRSSVTVGWAAFVTAFIFLPLVMMLVDYLKESWFKK